MYICVDVHTCAHAEVRRECHIPWSWSWRYLQDNRCWDLNSGPQHWEASTLNRSHLSTPQWCVCILEVFMFCVLVGWGFFVCFWDRISLQPPVAWELAVWQHWLQIKVICLPLLPKYWDLRHTPQTWVLIKFSETILSLYVVLRKTEKSHVSSFTQWQYLAKIQYITNKILTMTHQDPEQSSSQSFTEL